MTDAMAAAIPTSWCPANHCCDFPAAEGTHPEFQSDTWYLAGHLTGTDSGRRFAFITIFNRNRPGGEIVADFHTFALFDTDHGVYGTFTDYDMPPKNMEPGAVPKLTSAEGHLDLRYDSSAGTDHLVGLPRRCRRTGSLHLRLHRVRHRQQRCRNGITLHLTPTQAPCPSAVRCTTAGSSRACRTTPTRTSRPAGR